MNEIDVFQRMGRENQPVAPPRLDVSGAVLGEIRRARRRQTDPVVLAMTAVSAAAAAAVAVMAYEAWTEMVDPINSLLQPLVMVME